MAGNVNRNGENDTLKNDGKDNENNSGANNADNGGNVGRIRQSRRPVSIDTSAAENEYISQQRQQHQQGMNKTTKRQPLHNPKRRSQLQSQLQSNLAKVQPDTPKTEGSTPCSDPPSLASTPVNAAAGTAYSTSSETPTGFRGRHDLRSPGIQQTPLGANSNTKNEFKSSSNTTDSNNPTIANTNNYHTNHAVHVSSCPTHPPSAETQPVEGEKDHSETPLPDFITQTDKYGNATTPRNDIGLRHTNSPPNSYTAKNKTSLQEIQALQHSPREQEDTCDALLEGLRMMCCCLLPENPDGSRTASTHVNNQDIPISADTDKTEDDIGMNPIEQKKERLLPDIEMGSPNWGKKCLVLDLDETLVHSSFRAVPGADFVIPVQIEDVVHFVYVAKRPGVDKFLIEMAKHYEIVIYTASLNKYADPLLDLLDPHKTISARLFRESCVYYEGNYVKDLSLLNRDIRDTIIVDNSPNSYIFHPLNAIDCTSFIDDINDRELDQIGAFLAGVRNVDDVRDVSNLWRDWPNLPNAQDVHGLIYTSSEEDGDVAVASEGNAGSDTAATPLVVT
eukprot:CAMPEP_0184856820 /NCGR_PEP_ID=MMETSP0580-20130426/2001_1 /TAXON_ID=1118495 /ORGANISM="Dactyliosolen fragilissimus" /LENGTH=562 /DNA_ID=CAMNT_0027352071 /DNA_START=977 /DNA_END=2665 /DNA_ORIENTATION=-